MGGVTLLHAVPGARVSFQGKVFEVKQSAGLGYIIGQDLETAERHVLAIDALKRVAANAQTIGQLGLFDEPSAALVARRRLLIIEPLLAKTDRTEVAIRARADEFGVSRASIYRWITAYEDGRLAGLVPRRNQGAKGQRRLRPDVELVIDLSIEEFYLTPQRQTKEATWVDIERRCIVAGLPTPSRSTVYRRVGGRSTKEQLNRRGGKKRVRDEHTARGGIFNEAQHPLAIVEMDHCVLDIVVVSEDEERLPLGRPWLTLALDVFSRMVTGFYLTLDSPSSTSIGMCIQHSALSKRDYLERLGVEGFWPVWGFPQTIHTDNGRDFIGKMLNWAAEHYRIHLTRRPVGDPHFGGHIERFFRTLNGDVHGLPGTTFSEPKKRTEYDSKATAALTLRELERWLVEWIVNSYHRRTHRTLQMSPIRKWDVGIHGDGDKLGIGEIAVPDDPDRIRLDFLPFVERKIERYGVALNGIHYFSDALRPFVGRRNAKGRGEFYAFRYDPRDISAIYFADPESETYVAIPYRDITLPAMSSADLKAIKAVQRRDATLHRDSLTIHEAYQRLKDLANSSKAATKAARRARTSIVQPVASNSSLLVIQAPTIGEETAMVDPLPVLTPRRG